MDNFYYIIIALFLGFALADTLVRARNFPKIRLWRLMGLVSIITYFTLATFVPFLWDDALGAHRLFDLTALPFWAQFALGFFVFEAGTYFWHRTMHTVTPIWRFHQTHHSAERVDIWGAFYFHPLDMLGWIFLGSFCLVWIVGLAPEAAFAVNILATSCAMFQHTNINTPYWLGFIITRPESHSIHHQRGVHRYNYGDVPWFDILFGTFRNPKKFEGEAGFHDGSSRQFGDLLRGKIIS